MGRGPLHIQAAQKYWVDTPGVWVVIATHCFGASSSSQGPPPCLDAAKRLARLPLPGGVPPFRTCPLPFVLSRESDYTRAMAEPVRKQRAPELLDEEPGITLQRWVEGPGGRMELVEMPLTPELFLNPQ